MKVGFNALFTTADNSVLFYSVSYEAPADGLLKVISKCSLLSRGFGFRTI